MSLTASAAIRPGATRIAVTSGKGGVGKTSLTINLAVAMARLGHRVGILDADFALGNIDVMLGLTPDQHLGAVLDGLKSVDEVDDRGAVRCADHSGGQRRPVPHRARRRAVDSASWGPSTRPAAISTSCSSTRPPALPTTCST